MSFSIELELQKFPKHILLKDGKKASIRVLKADMRRSFTNSFSTSRNRNGCSSSTACRI